MAHPVFNGEITSELIANAQSSGKPVVNGLQAVAHCRCGRLGQPAVNWYWLEDGTEAIQDDQGNTVGWPS